LLGSIISQRLSVTYGVHWLAAEHVRGGAAIGYALVGVLTTGFALLTVRTVTGLIHGTFLPRVAATDQAGAAPPPPTGMIASCLRGFEFMNVQREELRRLAEELAEDKVPVVLDDVRRHLGVVRGRSWPPACFGAGEGSTTDVAAGPRVGRGYG
jgi:hypothetical protein